MREGDTRKYEVSREQERKDGEKTYPHGGVTKCQEGSMDGRANLATCGHYPVRGSGDVRMGGEGLGGIYGGIVFFCWIVRHVERGEVEHVERHVRVEGCGSPSGATGSLGRPSGRHGFKVFVRVFVVSSAWRASSPEWGAWGGEDGVGRGRDGRGRVDGRVTVNALDVIEGLANQGI